MIEAIRKLGIDVNNEKLYEVAFSHSSYANEHHQKKDYERLEFLGDAVLQLSVSEYLYKNYEQDEGNMTKTRANFVCENANYEYMQTLDLIKYIKVGNGEVNDIKKAIVADIFESLTGAIYLDKGFDVAKHFVISTVEPFISKKENFVCDYKSTLQEAMQTDKKSVLYETIDESGPAHDREFTVQVRIDNVVYGTGVGSSKKEASQQAAKATLEKLAKAEYHE